MEQIYQFLGAFAYSQKALISVVMSDPFSFRLSVSLRLHTRLPLKEYLENFTVGTSIKICVIIPRLVNIGQKHGYFT
jgi:hypothetical protein